MIKLTKTKPEQAAVLFIRHAQSQWNLENRFSGWADIALSERGTTEGQQAAQLIASHNINFDQAYSSMLTRAKMTLDIILKEINQQPPVDIDWRINERHYGALQGMNKTETLGKYGEEQYFRWRRGYTDHPPVLTDDDPRHPRFDSLFDSLPRNVLPNTESLAETEKRVIEFWLEKALPQIRDGKNILISAHGNTLRALFKYLNNLSVDEVEKLEVPTGKPILYHFDNNGGIIGSGYLTRKAAAC
ncbi:MAG: 2,3-bisphosphoglycerate-dependent phosphoglycerate mutase [Gammaproteobacteria bacterium]|nr:2,3-bisphosphoglycerate-dependent phosphoglycerate mutase [Gammaproteobacteria bacterium]